MREIINKKLTGERALYGEKDLLIKDSVFDGEGESPLKHSCDIELKNCEFNLKYPLWYADNLKGKDIHLTENARAGIWYTNNLTFDNLIVDSPKNFRRCKNITLKNVTLNNAAETLWSDENIIIENLKIVENGDYFAMNCKNMKAFNIEIPGKYTFDGCENVEIHNMRLTGRDAFWNCKNITVYDSCISGEYIGWNSENLTFINCTIESLQGFCYIKNLVLKNCRLENTTLAFEYSQVDAEISTEIDSIINPSEGVISAPRIGDLIIDKDKVDPSKIKIVCDDIVRILDKPEYV